MSTVTSSQIESLRDIMLDPSTPGRANPEWISQADITLARHVIERYEIPSKNPGVYGNPGASPGQLEFQKMFFSRKYQFMFAAGSNQSAKTVCVGGLCFCKHLRDHARNGDVYWVIAQSHETMRDIPHKTIWEFLPRSMFQTGLEYNPRTGFGMISTLNLILPDDRGRCEVWFKVEEAGVDKFESARLNGLWWTECTRETIWDALQPRLVARGGWVVADYVSVYPWLKYRWRLKAHPQIQESKMYWQLFTMPLNAHNLSEGSIETACENLTEEQARIRVYGEEGADRGVVYQEFKPEKHICHPFDIPKSWPRWRCYDDGYINPSTCLWVTVVPVDFKFPDGIGSMWNNQVADREIVLVYREFYKSELTVAEKAKIIIALSKGETYRMSGRVIADQAIFARNQQVGKTRSIAEEFRSHNLNMKRGKKGRGPDMHAQVAKVRLWFEQNKIMFFDTCENAVYEHQSWRYKSKHDGDFPGSEPYVDRDDHTCDAFRYLLQERLTYNLPTAVFETSNDF